MWFHDDGLAWSCGELLIGINTYWYIGYIFVDFWPPLWHFQKVVLLTLWGDFPVSTSRPTFFFEAKRPSHFLTHVWLMHSLQKPWICWRYIINAIVRPSIVFALWHVQTDGWWRDDEDCLYIVHTSLARNYTHWTSALRIMGKKCLSVCSRYPIIMYLGLRWREERGKIAALEKWTCGD